jgi:hypothetical protein
VRDRSLPQSTERTKEAILCRAELPAGDVRALSGMSERQSRHGVSALIEQGVVVSSSPWTLLRLALPARVAPRWLPLLFPERGSKVGLPSGERASRMIGERASEHRLQLECGYLMSRLGVA